MSSRWIQVSVTRAKIYVAANPLRSGSRKRTKECIATVRHLYLDFDIDGEARLPSLRVSDALPTPTAFISAWPGKYQVLWRIDCFTFEQQESTPKLLAIAFGGDHACTDCNRVLRLPELLNRKHDPRYPVTVEYPSDSNWNPDDFRLDIAAANAMLLPCSIPSQKHSGKHTNSQRHSAWVVHELGHGKDAEKLVPALASRRADLPSPLLLHTADTRCRNRPNFGSSKAFRCTMLEVRRRFEIPAALC